MGLNDLIRPRRKKQKKRRRNRRRWLTGRTRAKRAAHRARRALLATRAEIRECRRRGIPITDEQRERRDRQTEELLAARRRHDELSEKLRANRANMVRAAKAIKRLVARRKAAESQRMISRAEWGAAPPRGTLVRQSPLVAGVQHHSAMPALPATATVAEECARMRQLQSIHFGNGWTDIGYGVVVMPSGRVYEGRGVSVVGAHTLGHNTGYAGWCLDGNFEEQVPTPAGVAGCRRARELMGAESKRLYGHYQLNPTSCPGKHLKPKLGKEI